MTVSHPGRFPYASTSTADAERRRVALGNQGRAYGTTCIHENFCIRCSLLRIDPAQRPRLEEIRDNLLTRIPRQNAKAGPGKLYSRSPSRAIAATRTCSEGSRANRSRISFEDFLFITTRIRTVSSESDAKTFKI